MNNIYSKIWKSKFNKLPLFYKFKTLTLTIMENLLENLESTLNSEICKINLKKVLGGKKPIEKVIINYAFGKYKMTVKRVWADFQTQNEKGDSIDYEISVGEHNITIRKNSMKYVIFNLSFIIN